MLVVIYFEYHRACICSTRSRKSNRGQRNTAKCEGTYDERVPPAVTSTANRDVLMVAAIGGATPGDPCGSNSRSELPLVRVDDHAEVR